ncbi:hypothetical protein A3762_10370 [Oleiphilus sp. HI0125]|uniref:AraC family transcriptional regulator n=3 Tax=Oleiphilus sp. HI0125 TaxID=1822266 RepID=UPI0007C3C7D2|nr:AraC family transcriptional regulator [Oleiphilus sp. HI0125]KZZ57116.1 hypothetical protein A3762_10370 [Oleiphilus sp. HI0125]
MDVRHSIIGLVEMLKWMESKGHARSTLLSHTGIEESRLANPKETASSKEELQFYRNLLSASDDSNVLLEAGFNLNLPSYGVWGLALISSSTFGKAIELGIQFIDFTYTYNRIVLVEDNQYSGLRISQARDLGDLQMPMIERDISASFVLFRVLLQDESPVDEIRFSGPMTKPLSYYESLFSCRVLFDQPHNEILFLSEKLHKELPQHNELAMQLCMEQLEKIRPQLREEVSIADQVLAYLSSTPLYRADMEECAASLTMSSRTLRRKLTNEGESYQSILDTFRSELAAKYLNSTNMTLEEISERLGYSDAANFSHAFKRWHGYSPKSFGNNKH